VGGASVEEGETFLRRRGCGVDGGGVAGRDGGRGISAVRFSRKSYCP
jgi:hypothetical protein